MAGRAAGQLEFRPAMDVEGSVSDDTLCFSAPAPAFVTTSRLATTAVLDHGRSRCALTAIRSDCASDPAGTRQRSFALPLRTDNLQTTRSKVICHAHADVFLSKSSPAQEHRLGCALGSALCVRHTKKVGQEEAAHGRPRKRGSLEQPLEHGCAMLAVASRAGRA